MFRELTRKKQALSPEECARLLHSEKRGVLSLSGENGYPYGVPLNQYYLEEEGRLYFHSGKTGHKIDALRACPKASFCVYDSGVRREGDWALTFRSVIAFGQLREETNPAKVQEVCTALSRKFTDDEAYIRQELQTFTKNVLCFYLQIEHISGKTVHEA